MRSPDRPAAAPPGRRIPWDRTVRSAVAITTALLGAHALAGAAGVPVALAGAVCSVNGDHSGPVRERAVRFAAILAGGSAGLLLGRTAPTPGWGQVLCMTLAALAAAVVGFARPADQLFGLKLMVLTAIGTGMGTGLTAGRTVALYGLGCAPMGLLLVLALTRRRGRPGGGAAPGVPRVGGCGPARRDAVLRLPLCVGAAAVLAESLRPEHAFWLPLTAALAFRPADASVLRRVGGRVAGTVLGVLAAAAAAHTLSGWTAVLLAVLVGAVFPGATDRSYVLHTALASVVVLVLAVPGPPSDGTVITARLVDTLLACGIAVAVGHPWRRRPAAH
ncbi:FUSC family protein [Kitasatospora sp. NPDC094019]|uniref:FUSC family protein n=1 Tax=Kitasatospora sp. NPDC094019 TaxID=3364091 RepID=UPI0038228A9A